MKSFMKCCFAVLALTLAATTVSSAMPPMSVPEIDPSMGAGALALLGGAVMVIRGRKR